MHGWIYGLDGWMTMDQFRQKLFFVIFWTSDFIGNAILLTTEVQEICISLRTHMALAYDSMDGWIYEWMHGWACL